MNTKLLGAVGLSAVLALAAASSTIQPQPGNIPGHFVLSGVLVPTAFDGTRVDNYVPVDAHSGIGLVSGAVISQDASADTALTGFGLTGLAVGQEFELHNVSAAAKITFKCGGTGAGACTDTHSSVGNRITLPSYAASWSLTPGGSARIRYTGTGFRVLWLDTTDYPVFSVNGTTIPTNGYSDTELHWRTDWDSPGALLTGAQLPGGWGFSLASGGTNVSAQAGYRASVWQLSTGATNAVGAAVVTTNSAYVPVNFTSLTLDTAVEFDTLSTNSIADTAIIGFTNNTTTLPTAGCFVWYDHRNVLGGNSGNADKFGCSCLINGGATKVCLMDGSTCDGTPTVNEPIGVWGGSVAPDTNMYHIVETITSNSSFNVQINGVSACTISGTYIGTSGLRFTQAVIKNIDATTALTMGMDYSDRSYKLIQARP